MVEHSFGVSIVRICRLVCELCLMEKKKEWKKKEEQQQQNRNFRVRFSQLWGEVIELWGDIWHKNS